MIDPIRELLAFMIAKELHLLCHCGSPATQQSDRSHRPPMCDDHADPKFDDWRDIPQAKAFRKLLGTDRCGWPFDGVECDLPKGHEESHSWTRADHRR